MRMGRALSSPLDGHYGVLLGSALYAEALPSAAVPYPNPGSSHNVAEALRGHLALEITNAVISILPTEGEEQAEIASK
jgi:hypothetical protein